jgi:phenylalanyl-tRNA synthetase beta chain
MRVPLSWLIEFLDLKSRRNDIFDGVEFSESFVRDVTYALNDLGMVVEGVETVTTGLKNVVVAQVQQIEEIEGADHIRKIMVSCDEPELVSVVCGAYNFSVGDKVPFAKVGAVLPGGFEIARRKMKGVVSNGMLCSAKEVGLAEDSDGLMILPEALETGASLEEALGIFDDVVFDLAIEANRPDANCIAGVARDLAPRLGGKFVDPARVLGGLGKEEDTFSTIKDCAIVDREAASRLTVAIIEQPVSLKDAAVVRRRLYLCGMRSVSDIVDASNYVMIEYGFPSHPYDYDKLDGGAIRIRQARDGEVVQTLDGTVRTLKGGQEGTFGDVVITDASDSVVGVAGVMGGKETEIGPGTSKVLIELAAFNRAAIARTSKRLNLRSEASMRFERGVDPAATKKVLARICDLLSVEPTAVTDVGDTDPAMRSIDLRVNKVRSLLGVSDLDKADISRLLEPIGFEVDTTGDPLKVKVPTFRPDCDSEIDVIEEVARHYGYSNIKKTELRSPYVGRLTEQQRLVRQLRLFFRDRGLNETLTSSLLSSKDHEAVGILADPLFVANPLSKDELALRMSLLPGHLKAMVHNLSRRNYDISFFELGRVVSKEGSQRYEGLPNERMRVGVLLSDPTDAAARTAEMISLLLQFFSIDQVAFEGLVGDPSPSRYGYFPRLHRGRTGAVRDENGEIVLVAGELSPNVVSEMIRPFSKDRFGWIEFDLEAVMAMSVQDDKAEPYSSFTSTDLDLAFELPEGVGASQLVRVVQDAAGEIAKSVRIFDVFRSEKLSHGDKSIAVRLRLENLEHAVSEVEVQSVIDSTSKAVAKSLGGVLREQR